MSILAAAHVQTYNVTHPESPLTDVRCLMRLLKIQQDGALSLTELYKNNSVPAYAILSHTWREGEEVTFAEFENGTGEHKAGYKKIRFTAQQAQRDSLRYFWVDTCCIDKSSSAELSEAINSMFRWYKNVKRCYVYLSDVSSNTSNHNPKYSWRWRREFKKSRWFTRGWTLQELLAPKDVVFYNRDWKKLGTKSRYARWISRITNIDMEALEESSQSISERLESFSIAKRMSWASRRTTTCEEDIAYCLLGIFNINMPLLYGERERAFGRLQQEIMKSRCDDSILAWGLDIETRFQQLPDVEDFPSHSPILASSPEDFKDCGSLVCASEPGHSFNMANLGLEIQMPMVPICSRPSKNALTAPNPHTLWLALLNCSPGINNELIGIVLYLSAAWDHNFSPPVERVSLWRDDLPYDAVIVCARVALQSVSRKVVIVPEDAGRRSPGYFLGYRQIVLNLSQTFQETGYGIRDAKGLNIDENRGLFGYSAIWDPRSQVLTIEGKHVSKDLLLFCFQSQWTLPRMTFTVFLRTVDNRALVRQGSSFTKEDVRRIYDALGEVHQEGLDETTITDRNNEPFRVVVRVNEVAVYGWRMFEVNVDALKSCQASLCEKSPSDTIYNLQAFRRNVCII